MLKRLSIQNRILTLFALIMLLGIYSMARSTIMLVELNDGIAELARFHNQINPLYKSWPLLTEMKLSYVHYYLDEDEVWLSHFEVSNAWLDRQISGVKEADFTTGRSDEDLEDFPQDVWKQYDEVQSTYKDNFSNYVADEDYTAVLESDKAMREILLLLSKEASSLLEMRAKSAEQLDDAIFFRFIWVSFVMLVLAWVILWTIHRQINRPIVIMTQAVTAAKQGSFEPEAVQSFAERQDEIGRLATALLDMTASAAARQTKLREEIAEIRQKI